MRNLLFSLLILLCSGSLSSVMAGNNHVILTGGPALRQWEDLRLKRDQHDRWWANFIRASTIRMDEIRKVNGKSAKITWIVYRDAYYKRGVEDGRRMNEPRPYVEWIKKQAAKRNASLIWVSTGGQAISAINRQPSGSIVSFDFFGHSNKNCFLLDYSAEIIGSSKAWIHENELGRLSRRVFAPNAHCQSWGCHTGESMSAYWKAATGQYLLGAKGKTNYEVVGQGKLPSVSGSWVR